MRLYLIILIGFILPLNPFAQNLDNSDFIKSTDEKILNLKKEVGFYLSKYQDKLLFSSRENDKFQFHVYSEVDESFSKFNIENNGFHHPLINDGYLSLLDYFDGCWVYTIAYFSKKETYQEIWIQRNKKDVLLMQIDIADKIIDVKFNEAGSLLIISTLNEMKSMYEQGIDDYLHIFNVKNIGNYPVTSDKLLCGPCKNAYIINDTIFFNRVNKIDAYGGFSNLDIYKAPLKNISDSIKIASNTEIINISTNGDYILGRRFDDRKKLTDIILKVKSQEFQMLIGREYYDLGRFRVLYSEVEKKFAYVYKNRIIYFIIPQNFPFDAMKAEISGIPDYSDKKFWNKFKLKPLD